MFSLPPSFFTLLSVVKWIFIVADAALLIGFAYAFVKGWHYHPRFEIKRLAKARKTLRLRDQVMKERWESIVKRFSVGTVESARLAVIEADALVDTAIKNMGVEGEHLADRLSNMDTEDITTINRLWRAHRMRNDLVHTPGFALSVEDAKLALGDYEAFLKEIEVL